MCAYEICSLSSMGKIEFDLNFQEYFDPFIRHILNTTTKNQDPVTFAIQNIKSVFFVIALRFVPDAGLCLKFL